MGKKDGEQLLNQRDETTLKTSPFTNNFVITNTIRLGTLEKMI